MHFHVIFWIMVGSLILGWIRYKQVFAGYDFNKDETKTKKNAPWQFKFTEIWNNSAGFFVGGIIAYYFYSIRWPLILQSSSIGLSDFILIFIFILSLFGHLSVLSLNLTKGIEAILDRALRSN